MNDTDINQVAKTIQEANQVLYNKSTPLGQRPKGGERGVNYNSWYGSNDSRTDNTWGNSVRHIQSNDDAQESDVELSDNEDSSTFGE